MLYINPMGIVRCAKSVCMQMEISFIEYDKYTKVTLNNVCGIILL